MFRERLASYTECLPELNENQILQLERHFDLLLRWNRVLNLSAVRGEGEIVERHYCESLFAAGRLPPGSFSIADLGSGAGFPGIPIAIARPECSVCLIESHRRKAVFLKEAARDLGNVRVLAKRAEEISETFDWVVSRAVNASEMMAWVEGHARAVGLLAGSEPQSSRLLQWAYPVKLPWGVQRYWHSGENVSRETS